MLRTRAATLPATSLNSAFLMPFQSALEVPGDCRGQWRGSGEGTQAIVGLLRRQQGEHEGHRGPGPLRPHAREQPCEAFGVVGRAGCDQQDVRRSGVAGNIAQPTSSTSTSAWCRASLVEARSPFSDAIAFPKSSV